uniref:NB-ARC domain-containing protein n=1 Tax=Heterorhabditis bacteriophora TaxID=37862 RepID=A0A1I7XPT7_HETBA
MLSEPECRVLAEAYDILVQDFDPKDAVIYLEGSSVINQDIAETIEIKTTRIERLRELLRVYKRRANDLTPLIEYFKFAGQNHIANFLSERVENALDNHRDDVTLDLPHFKQMSSVVLSKQIQDALIDRPNVLIVLDDVVQVDTVRWADRLGLRILATTRDAELFAVAQSSVDIISIGGLSDMECQQLLGLHGIFAGEGCIKAWQAVNSAFEVSSGNPALLTMLGKLSGGKHDRLFNYCRRLTDHGLSAISTTSSYEYHSLHVALNYSVERLSVVNRDTLACIAVMPPNQWIPIEVWALVIPVDLCDQDDLLAVVREQLSRLHFCGCWLEEAEDGEAFRMNSLVATYLKEVVEVATTQTVLSIMESRVMDNFKNEKVCIYVKSQIAFIRD